MSTDSDASPTPETPEIAAAAAELRQHMAAFVAGDLHGTDVSPFRALSFAVDRLTTWAAIEVDDDAALGRRIRAIAAARAAIADELISREITAVTP